jgi:VWFA-related protein
MYAKQQFIKFLGTLRPEDHVAVYLLGAKLRVLNDFTNDSRRLLAAVKRYSGEIVAVTENSEPEANKAVGSALDQTGDARDMDRVLNDFDAVLAEQAIIDRVQTTAAALEAIANHVAHIPGRKNLIWITGSFPISVGQYKSAEAAANPNDQLSNAIQIRRAASTRATAAAAGGTSAGSGSGGSSDATAIYGANTPYSDPARYGFRGFEDEIKRASRAVNNANIAVYPVDARGLITMPKVLTAQSNIAFTPGQSKAALDVPLTPTGTHSLQMIADSTGGRAFYNTNDLKNAIRTALDDSEITYTLGFYADSKALDAEFHDLKVTVKRKDLEVRFRKGYVADPDPPPTADERAANIRDAIGSPLEATGIRFFGNIEIVNKPKPGAVRISVLIERDQVALPAQDGRRSGMLDVVFVQQSAAGEELEKIEQKVPLNITQAQYDALSQGLLLDRTLDPVPSAVQIRVVLCDRTSGQLGSLTIPLKH